MPSQCLSSSQLSFASSCCTKYCMQHYFCCLEALAGLSSDCCVVRDHLKFVCRFLRSFQTSQSWNHFQQTYNSFAPTLHAQPFHCLTLAETTNHNSRHVHIAGSQCAYTANVFGMMVSPVTSMRVHQMTWQCCPLQGRKAWRDAPAAELSHRRRR